MTAEDTETETGPTPDTETGPAPDAGPLAAPPDRARAHAAGERLRAERVRLGLSMALAARASGVKATRWRDLENGKFASLDKLYEIASALGIDPHALDERLCPRAVTLARIEGREIE